MKIGEVTPPKRPGILGPFYFTGFFTNHGYALLPACDLRPTPKEPDELSAVSCYFTGSRGVFSRASAGHKRKSLVKIGEVTPAEKTRHGLPRRPDRRRKGP